MYGKILRRLKSPFSSILSEKLNKLTIFNSKSRSPVALNALLKLIYFGFNVFVFVTRHCDKSSFCRAWKTKSSCFKNMNGAQYKLKHKRRKWTIGSHSRPKSI